MPGALLVSRQADAPHFRAMVPEGLWDAETAAVRQGIPAGVGRAAGDALERLFGGERPLRARTRKSRCWLGPQFQLRAPGQLVEARFGFVMRLHPDRVVRPHPVVPGRETKDLP